MPHAHSDGPQTCAKDLIGDGWGHSDSTRGKTIKRRKRRCARWYSSFLLRVDVQEHVARAARQVRDVPTLAERGSHLPGRLNLSQTDKGLACPVERLTDRSCRLGLSLGSDYVGLSLVLSLDGASKRANQKDGCQQVAALCEKESKNGRKGRRTHHLDDVLCPLGVLLGDLLLLDGPGEFLSKRQVDDRHVLQANVELLCSL